MGQLRGLEHYACLLRSNPHWPLPHPRLFGTLQTCIARPTYQHHFWSCLLLCHQGDCDAFHRRPLSKTDLHLAFRSFEEGSEYLFLAKKFQSRLGVIVLQGKYLFYTSVQPIGHPVMHVIWWSV